MISRGAVYLDGGCDHAEALVGRLGLLSLLFDLPAQPLPRLGGRLGAQVQALLDVDVGEGIGGGGGELGAAGADADVDEAAVADGTDGEATKEGIDAARLNG